MGHRLHFPRDGAKVGSLTVQDPRARFARITLDGVDVTHGYTPNAEAFGDLKLRREFLQMPAQLPAKPKYQVVAANDVEGWIAYLVMPARFVAQAKGDVTITFQPSDAVRAAAAQGKTSLD